MITIDGATPKQPTDVNENPVQVQTDQESINRSMQRNRMGKKEQVILTWPHLRTTEYQALIALFESGNPVVYSNNQSNRAGGVLTFTGLPTYEQGNYYRGQTLMVPLTVTIREV